MLISIDHGNKLIKTCNSEPFTGGLLETDAKPFGSDVLEYKGKYYQLTDQRIPYHRNKFEDERYFVLTLFAIAREIDAKGSYHPGAIDVQLAVGLPPAHYGTQYQQFCAFFLNRGPIHFEYHSRKYSVVITKAVCYPQSYAAAITMFQALKRIPRALILDIGGVTVDYMQIKNGGGDMSVSDSLESGVIMMYNRIVSKVRAEHDIILSEPEIDAILLGQNVQTTPEVIQLTERLAQEFTLDLLSALRERQLELRSGQIVFVGGGSILLRRQIESSGKVVNPIFVDDINANAKGYELLYQLGQK